MSNFKKDQSECQEQPQDIETQSWQASLPAFEAELVKLKTQWQAKQNPRVQKSKKSKSQKLQVNSTFQPYIQGTAAKLSPEELTVEKQIRFLECARVRLRGRTYAELSVGLPGARKVELVREMFEINNISWNACRYRSTGKRSAKYISENKKNTSVRTVPGGLPSLGKRR